MECNKDEETRAMEIAQRKVGVPVQRRQLDEL